MSSQDQRQAAVASQNVNSNQVAKSKKTIDSYLKDNFDSLNYDNTESFSDDIANLTTLLAGQDKYNITTYISASLLGRIIDRINDRTLNAGQLYGAVKTLEKLDDTKAVSQEIFKFCLAYPSIEDRFGKKVFISLDEMLSKSTAMDIFQPYLDRLEGRAALELAAIMLEGGRIAKVRGAVQEGIAA